MATAPYEKDTCLPDLSIVLIDARKLQINVLEAVSWWTNVLNWNERFALCMYYSVYYSSTKLLLNHILYAGVVTETLPYF